MCTTVETGQVITKFNTVERDSDSRLGDPTKEHAEADKTANSKGSEGILVEKLKEGRGGEEGD